MELGSEAHSLKLSVVRMLAGRKGGKSRSRRKLAALRISLKAARAARWPTKGVK